MCQTHETARGTRYRRRTRPTRHQSQQMCQTHKTPDVPDAPDPHDSFGHSGGTGVSAGSGVSGHSCNSTGSAGSGVSAMSGVCCCCHFQNQNNSALEKSTVHYTKLQNPRSARFSADSRQFDRNLHLASWCAWRRCIKRSWRYSSGAYDQTALSN
jgi:hypothetical protein